MWNKPSNISNVLIHGSYMTKVVLCTVRLKRCLISAKQNHQAHRLPVASFCYMNLV